uniref:Uncharacterized protein n=1 Tax=Periophthalmus magnuspinnatus TaxID=409849 RepID=A0A3B3Z8E8_9GOBI
GDDITIKSYRIESHVTSRFAHTTVRSHVVNSGAKAQTIGFNVQIPKRAFISNFTRNVNGIIFKGSVKEKSVAQNLYNRAKARGKAASILANSQDMETFQTEVYVPPGSNIEFELNYQEMMQRKMGFYEHQLYLQPGRLVPHFQHIVFKPSLQQQRKCSNCTDSAIDGVLNVIYDVKRDNNGELQVSDGYFVQFFAPTNLSPLPKNIVFVIDVSGSMWGVKMKQTVEAMQAILDDLTVDDHFSVIDFNHNVRCWNEDLVSGSRLQVGNAKKYIQDIKPNGTNINEALMRAVQILVRASNQGLIDPRSVSMIILVSDGDPTVETKLSTIQKNVKRVMKEDFSLFSLGIGFDVDYDFLERIAMENRGIAQRIYANHNAADQLRAFYSQVSAPLLRRITIQFPEDSVSDVTQNQFDKFFSGSELVVAGKVLPSDTNTLTSFTTASAARLDLTLETETDTTELDQRLANLHHSFPGFARQLWAYITIKQLIAEAMASTAAKKRKITQKILSLAVDHQFVTPLTALLVESEDEVDNDPHFIIHLPRHNVDVCFNIDSKPGHILNLLSDSGTVVVNGQLIGSKKLYKNKVSTYFGTISVYSQPEGVSVTASTDNITISDERNSHVFSWDATADITQDVRIHIMKKSNVTITINGNIQITVLLHRIWKKHPVNVDFLGIYMPTNNQYSPLVHGLIQFSREPDVNVYDVREGVDPLKKEATMEVKGNQLQVTGWQKDYRTEKKHGSIVYCWFVHSSGKGFIDGHYTDYIVPHL